MMWWPAEWSFEAWVNDRTIDQRWLLRARSGRCSQIWTPGVRVEMGRNSPRMPSGASGLGSKLSCWASPPERKMKITDWAGCGLRAGSSEALADRNASR
jgi:hypothetical protein